MIWKVKSELTLVLFLFMGMAYMGCKTQKNVNSEGFQNDYFGIKGLPCKETIGPDAIDSHLGRLDCENISFTYDFGPFSNPGPLTTKEEFIQSFDTYHHTKLFENRMIDPKVYRIFLDSVKVINVERKNDSHPLLIKCDPCNAVAEMTFLGETYFYPFTMSEKQLDMEGFTYSFEEKGEFLYKYYQRDNELPGLYITPIKNRYKAKNTLSLRVTETTLSSDQIHQLFQSVFLKQ
ncbi:MAG: hypothetical protein AAGA77_19270 [Bacteroidota bacterium]